MKIQPAGQQFAHKIITEPPKPDSQGAAQVIEDIITHSSDVAPVQQFNPNSILAAAKTVQGKTAGLSAQTAPPDMVSGPIGAVLAKQLHDLIDRNVPLLLKREHTFGILNNYDTITAEKAERILTDDNAPKKARLFAGFEKGHNVPIPEAADVQRIASFLGADSAEKLADKKTAEFLHNAEKDGFTFTGGSEEVNTVEAYLALAHPEKAGSFPPESLRLNYRGISVSALTAETCKDREKLEALMKDAKIALQVFDPDTKTAEGLLLPVGSTTIEERISVWKDLESLLGSEGRREKTKQEYEQIKMAAAKGADFTLLGNSYCELIKGISAAAAAKSGSSSKKAEPSPEALAFLAAHLKESPSMCRTFINLACQGVDVHSLCRIHDGLRFPVGSRELEETALQFKGDEFWSPFWVEQVMKDGRDIPLACRMNTIREICSRIKSSYSSKSCRECQSEDYHRIREHAEGADDFRKCTSLYLEIVDACKEKYKDRWSEDYGTAFNYAAEKMKDDPARFECFVAIIRKGTDAKTAIAIMESLPKLPGGKDYLDMGRMLAGFRGRYQSGQYGKLDADGCLKRDLEHLKTLAGSGDRLPALTSMYASVLEAFGSRHSGYWDEEYSTALDYAAANLKDVPNRFECFVSIIRGGASAKTAMEVMESLPELPDGKDYNDMGSVLAEIRGRYQSGQYGKLDADECLKRDLEHLNELAGSGDRLTALTSMYASILEAFGNRNSGYWEEEYSTALDYAAANLKDIPNRFECFISIIRGGASAKTAMEVMESLPELPDGKDYLDMGRMLAEIRGRYQSGQYGKLDADGCLKRDLEHLKTLAGSGDRLPALTSMYASILETFGSRHGGYWDEEYSTALGYAAANLKDDLSRFECFVSMIKGGTDAKNAVEILESLPKLTDGKDYKHMGNTLAEIRGRYTCGEYNKLNADGCLKRDLEHLKELAGSGDALPALTSMYAAILKAFGSRNSGYWNSGYSAAMDYTATKLKDNPSRFECLVSIIRGGTDAKIAIEMMEILPSFPDGKDLQDMGRILPDLRSKYTNGEYGKLGADGCLKRDLEHLKKLAASDDRLIGTAALYLKMLEAYGEQRGSYWLPEYSKGIDYLHTLVENNPGAAPLFMMMLRFNEQNEALSDGAKEKYALIADSLGDVEDFSGAEQRMNLLSRTLCSRAGKDKNKLLQAGKDTMDSYMWLATEYKKGSFNGRTLPDITSLLCELLVAGSSLEEAKKNILFSLTPGEGLNFEQTDDSIVIGGVKLDVKGHRE